MSPAAHLADPATAGPAHWRHSLLLAATAFGVFLLLPQRTLHGVDGNVFTVWIETGYRDYARHVAYLHFCGLIHDLFGGSGFQALRLASALGAAAGLFCLHRAFRRLPIGNLQSAVSPTLAVCVTPAWFFYATSAEVHGVFAAGLGAAWWAYSRWLCRPTAAAAVALGAATAFAASLHAFGHLLPPSFALLAWLWRRTPPRGGWLQLCAFAVAHGGLTLAVSSLLASGAGGQANDAIGHLQERWATFAPGTTLTVVVREWLLPFLPWSLAALAGLAVPRARATALATLLMLAVHLPFTVLLLGFIAADESGAYLLAVVPAAVLAAAHLLSARGFVAAVAASAALAAGLAAPGWSDPVAPEWNAGFAAIHAERRPALLVANAAELSAARTATGTMVLQLVEVLGAYTQSRGPDQTFAAWFDEWFSRLAAIGMPLLATEAACDFFDKGPDAELRAFWRDHVPHRYRVTPAARLGFRGAWIEPK